MKSTYGSRSSRVCCPRFDPLPSRVLLTLASIDGPVKLSFRRAYTQASCHLSQGHQVVKDPCWEAFGGVVQCQKPAFSPTRLHEDPKMSWCGSGWGPTPYT